MITKYRVAIVEDEPFARQGLRRMIEALPDATVVGEAGSGPDAVRMMRDADPQIVFLDVNLPGCNAFDVLARSSPDRMPTIILVTAFEEHAVQAFELGVTDYLLKPFDQRRLQRAWNRALETRQSMTTVRTTASIAAGTRLLLRRNGRVHAVTLNEVEWIEAADNYVRVHSTAGRFMWRIPLRSAAERLAPAGFALTSRSALANTAHVDSIMPLESGDGRVRLRSGTELQLSRRYCAAFQNALGGTAPHQP